MADIPEKALMDAVDILKTYADFIRNDVRADDFERHPYVPHIEQTIEDLRAAPPAMDREAAYRQALEDVCNPLGYLQRMADAEGAKLSGMAYAIASDIGTIQRIAKEALSTLSADAIRQGEGWRLVPVEPTHRMIRAAAESVARDDEGAFEPVMDLLGFSGENKTHTVLRQLLTDAIAATPASDGGEA